MPLEMHKRGKAEEGQARRQLSRLIHTVQHFPSNRCRLDTIDTNSLWNLVGELETFRPPSPAKSVQFPKRTAKQSFSRKYLDLRLYPSPDRSVSPELRKPVKSSSKEEKKPQTFRDSHLKKSKRSKKNDLLEVSRKPNITIITHVEPEVVNNENNCRNKRLRLNEGCNNDKALSQHNLRKRNSRGDMQTKYFQSLKKLKQEHEHPTDPQTVLRNKSKERLPCVSSFKYNKKTSAKQKLQESCKVLGKIRHLKTNNKLNSQLKYVGNTLQQPTFFTDRESNTDQSSMVKTLTSYWNSLLNDESDEKTSSQETIEIPDTNTNVQFFAKNITANRNSRSKSRVKKLGHGSNSNILDNVESLSTSSHISDSKLLVQVESTDYSEDDKKYNVNLKESLISKKEREPLLTEDCVNEQNFNIQEFPTEMGVKTEKTIEVMENLICKMKTFPDLPLTSNQIGLSRPVKTLLCLLTATVMSYPEEAVLQESETSTFEDIEEKKKNACSDTVIDENEISKTHESSISSTPARLDDTLVPATILVSMKEKPAIGTELVPVKGLTIRKVEDALKYFHVCKEFWRKKCGFDQRVCEQGPQIQSFELVFEEKIIFENVIEQEYFESDSEESNIQEVRESEICRMMYFSVSDCLKDKMESMVEKIADCILNFLPDSIDHFLRSIYYVSISVLAWWVILKEIFFE